MGGGKGRGEGGRKGGGTKSRRSKNWVHFVRRVGVITEPRPAWSRRSISRMTGPGGDGGVVVVGGGDGVGRVCVCVCVCVV